MKVHRDFNWWKHTGTLIDERTQGLWLMKGHMDFNWWKYTGTLIDESTQGL